VLFGNFKDPLKFICGEQLNLKFFLRQRFPVPLFYACEISLPWTIFFLYYREDLINSVNTHSFRRCLTHLFFLSVCPCFVPHIYAIVHTATMPIEYRW